MRVTFHIRTIGVGTEHDEEQAVSAMVEALESAGPFRILTVERSYDTPHSGKLDGYAAVDEPQREA